MELQRSLVIHAPPPVVFAAAADIRSWPERIEAITKIEVHNEAPVNVGTRFEETRMMFGREATEEMEVVEFVPGERFVLIAESNGMRYRSTHTFESVDEGTRLTFQFSGEAVSPAARLLAPLTRMMLPSVLDAIEGDLKDIKASVEAEYGSKPSGA